MAEIDRNTFVDGDWILSKIRDIAICKSFDCGHKDLNDYFHNDIVAHKAELLSQSYYLHMRQFPDIVFALLDFCNDAVKLNSLKKYLEEIGLAEEKQHYRHLPAVKLTRLGVAKEHHDEDVGTYLLNMVKKFFTTDNRTGCRFITVDSYIEATGFYTKNGFSLLTEKDRNEKTRTMYYDLKRLTG